MCDGEGIVVSLHMASLLSAFSHTVSNIDNKSPQSSYRFPIEVSDEENPASV